VPSKIAQCSGPAIGRRLRVAWKADETLQQRVERLRRSAGPRMLRQGSPGHSPGLGHLLERDSKAHHCLDKIYSPNRSAQPPHRADRVPVLQERLEEYRNIAIIRPTRRTCAGHLPLITGGPRP